MAGGHLAGVVIVHAYVNPVVAVILGIALHEGVTLRQAAGMALVAGSVALTLYRSAGACARARWGGRTAAER